MQVILLGDIKKMIKKISGIITGVLIYCAVDLIRFLGFFRPSKPDSLPKGCVEWHWANNQWKGSSFYLSKGGYVPSPKLVYPPCKSSDQREVQPHVEQS